MDAEKQAGSASGRRSPRPNDMEPLFELHPEGGQVLVTRFECGTVTKLLYMVLLHLRVKRDVHRFGDGLIGSRVVIDWRHRVMLSISLWPDIDSVYSMGSVPRHIAAARIPGRFGIRTTCGVFCFAGDWRHVMFGSPVEPRTPFLPVDK